MKTQLLTKIGIVVFASVLWLGAPQKAQAMYPVFDSMANTIGLKNLAQTIQQLQTEIEQNQYVQDILTVNREATDIQKNISDSIGDVRDVMKTATAYASQIKGTIDYWKNFDITKMVPFFDPKVFTAYSAFLDLKSNMSDLTTEMQNTKLQSGSPFGYLTMENYYDQYSLMKSLDRAQQVNRWGSEIASSRTEIEGLTKINEMTKASARELGRISAIVNEISYQTLDEGVNEAIIDQGRIAGQEKALRASYDNVLNQD